MRPRTALIAVTALALAAPAPAMAAAKKKPAPIPKVCMLMTDVAGDGDWNMASTVESDAIDIVSGDIATGKSEFVAVLRLKSTAAMKDTYSSLGYSWTMSAKANGTEYLFEYKQGAIGGSGPSSSVRVGDQTGLAHTFQIAGDTFVWKVKRSLVKAMARPGLVWTDVNGFSKVLSSSADTAGSEKKYADRTPSCVAAL